MVTAFATVSDNPAREGIAVWRLTLLRAGYGLIAAGMGTQIIPAFLRHGPWTLYHGVMNSMLLSLVLLSALGVRYPLKMLPLLFWEMAWKTIWLTAVALPLWRAGAMDADTTESVFDCAIVVVFYAIVPWDYVVAQFVKARSERWW
jgi:hypothetical protein